MKAEEKRKARAYKIADKPYKKAMRRAKKDKVKLASMVEDFVFAYAEGAVSYLIEFYPKTLQQ